MVRLLDSYIMRRDLDENRLWSCQIKMMNRQNAPEYCEVMDNSLKQNGKMCGPKHLIGEVEDRENKHIDKW